MSLIERAIAAKRKNAEHHDPSLANKPAPKIAILTCMDPRPNELFEGLDVKPAEADVIRNVGAAVTEENHLHTQRGVWAAAPDKFHFNSDGNRATQKQVLKLRSHAWIPSKVLIRGFGFDVATGELREVTLKDDR